MTYRETLLRFLDTHYKSDDLDWLAQAVGVSWTRLPGNDQRLQIEVLLLLVERAGALPRLAALLEKAHPGQLPALPQAARPDASVALPTASLPPATIPETDAFANIPPAMLHTPVRDDIEGLEAARRQQDRPSGLVEYHTPVPVEELFTGGAPPTEDLQGEGAETEGPSARRKPYRFVHGYTLPQIWAKRDQEIAQLAAEVKANQHRILSLIAIGGTGKSALTRKLLDELPRQQVALDGALWFSFYIEPEFDRFLTEACRYLIPGFDPAAHPSPYEKGVMLREAMDEGRYLFVLDGIEILLVSDPNRRDYGAFRDRALREFLEGICEGSQSQILISSRFPLTELTGKPGYYALKLGDLAPEAAGELLTAHGVAAQESEQEAIFARFGYHALTLQLLGYYLSRYCQGDPKGLLNLPEFPPDSPQGIRLQAVLDGFWQRLLPDERFFLTRLSAFRGGVDERSLIVLNSTQDPFNAPFRAMTQQLLQSPLVNVERRDGRPRLTAHPLIKNFFYERMVDRERDQTHRALKDYAQGLPIPDRPRTLEDYEPLREACHHCLKVGLYTEAYQMYRRNNMDNAMRWWGHYSQALELLEPLREASQGDAPAWQCERWQKSWVENEMALLAVLRGDNDQAISGFQRSIELDEQSGDLSGASASWQNLAGVLILRGNYRGALDALERSRRLEAQLGRYEKEDYLAGLEGVAQMELGYLQRAFDLLKHALDISTHQSNYRAVCFWRWRLGDLYLYVRQADAGLKQHAEALRIAKAEQFRDYEGHALRGLGDALRLQGDRGQAGVRYGAAMRTARTLGNPFLENEVRLRYAWLSEADNKWGDAANSAEQVLRRAQESGYLTQAAEARLVLARIAYTLEERVAYEEQLGEIQSLLEQTGYHAIRRQLDQLTKGKTPTPAAR